MIEGYIYIFDRDIFRACVARLSRPLVNEVGERFAVGQFLEGGRIRAALRSNRNAVDDVL